MFGDDFPTTLPEFEKRFGTDEAGERRLSVRSFFH